MSEENEKEFLNIIKDIITNEEFKKLKNQIHHGTNRYSHLYRVARNTYIKSKEKGLDYNSATRATILHDFFTQEDVLNEKSREVLFKHPNVALYNASKYYDINEIEENIILSHMYPLSKIKPQSKEARIVSLADKKVSIEEFFKYKIPYEINKTKEKRKTKIKARIAH